VEVENKYFDVLPKIVRADAESMIEIVPRFEHCAFRPDRQYEASYFPTEESAERSGWSPGRKLDVAPATDRLRVPLYFEGEQEHVLYVEEVNGTERKVVGDFRVYSLEDDLFARRPYKGDVHQHSCRSDGREAPAYVAGACRRIGLDFMALTDHGQYMPSIEAQRAYEGLDLDLRIYPGEEVHPPANPVHMINFGGRFSVNELFRDESAYRAGVAQIEEALGAVPPGVDPHQYASCQWCFDRIREAGGLGVFCHPYWFTSHRYSPSGALTSYLFQKQPFDAFELIGGFHRDEVDSNTLQVARYHEERAQGRRIPIVGVSDAHGCERGELFGWYYSIAFSPSSDLPDLVESIKDLYSVAVEAIPQQAARAYGPFRLVKYALFLLREVFPQHDALCVEEGRLMLEHAGGNTQAGAALGALKGRTRALLQRYWAP